MNTGRFLLESWSGNKRGGGNVKRERLCGTMSISRLGHVEEVVKRLLGPKNCQFHAWRKGSKLAP